MTLWAPLTAQYGDLTYWGEWILHRDTVHVRCDHGSGRAPVDFDNPLATAERLLIEILRARGRL